MATSETFQQRTNWLPGNPWFWMLVGLGSSGLALLWTRILATHAAAGRLSLIILGLLTMGIGLVLRINDSCGSFLDDLSPGARRAAFILMQWAGLLLVIAALLLLLASCCNLDIPWRTSIVLFITNLALPAGVWLWWLATFHQKRPSRRFSRNLESGIMLLLAAVIVFLSGWALYVTYETEQEWDTLRHAALLFSLVAYVGGVLTILPQVWRRVGVSLLVLLHFTAILHAVLSAPPAVPWLVQQNWQWFFRPYLEFVFLNNAYQFYAPDPGPSGFMWYRVEYERPNQEKRYRWVKFPEMKDNGQPNYLLALNYQRRVAMTELVARYDNPPLGDNPIYYWRRVNSPDPPSPVLGKKEPQIHLQVPLHPEITLSGQYEPTTRYFRELIASYARHVVRQPHPEVPDAVGKTVQVYRVRHWILPQIMAREGVGPYEPYLYRPYYQGKFDREGKLLDMPEFDNDGHLIRGDPFLYWLLPFEYTNPNSWKESAIRGWVFRHAGDPNWVRYPGRKFWEPEKSGLDSLPKWLKNR